MKLIKSQNKVDSAEAMPQIRENLFFMVLSFMIKSAQSLLSKNQVGCMTNFFSQLKLHDSWFSTNTLLNW